MKLFAKSKLWLVDCVNPIDFEVAHFPFEIGSGHGCDLKIPGEEVCEKHCAIIEARGGKWLVKRSPHAVVKVDGVPLGDSMEIQEGKDHTLRVGERLFLFRLDVTVQQWRTRFVSRQWSLYHEPTNRTVDFSFLSDLPKAMKRVGCTEQNGIVFLQGAETGFFVADVIGIKDFNVLEDDDEEVLNGSGTDDLSSTNEAAAPDGYHGELLCPVCWKRFERRDIMHIACHPDLLGDPVLGPDHMLRFLATSFNSRHQAVDPKGVGCTEVACPHCRRRLPAGFLDIRYHLFSIVGVPSAGKSYFLASMLHCLKQRMSRDLRMAFTDADAADNTVLNSMAQRLFSHSLNPADLFLNKTQVQGGDMVEFWERDGRRVQLPKPFSFMVSGGRFDERGARPFSVVFYDNAGEHFEAGRSHEDSISAQHMTCSDGILFLFDPTCTAGFRQRLPESPDAQLKDFRRLDQQEEIIAHMRNRIRNELGLPAWQKIATPVAFLVGKCDTWQHLMGTEPLPPALRDGKVDTDAVMKASERVRDLMLDACPSVVTTIESISSTVVFFPVSALGHSPEFFQSADGNQRFLGPVPGRLRPFNVEVPMLWMMHRLYPQLFPGLNGQ